MKNIWKAAVAFSVVAAFGAVGCERRDDGVDDRVERKTYETRDELRDVGDRIEQAGKDIRADFRDGITFEVAKIDKEAKMVELRRANALPGVTDKKDLQKGEMLTVSFAELENYVEGDKAANEIADELHVGENVSVFMDEKTKTIKKITY